MPAEVTSDSVRDAVTHVRKQLCDDSLQPIVCGLDSEKNTLQDLISATARLGESNSIIVIGPRGSGKSLLLRAVLSDLYEDGQIQENLLKVNLNGLLQTNDNLAIQEIALQLGLENVVGERVSGTFAENLKFLLDALKSGDGDSKPILFILDEFDLFTNHRNQTLLYNLFDVAQSQQAPVCVVGMTTRLDVLELLEKRVKSRFSHRLLHLVRGLTFEEYMELMTVYLSLPTQSFTSRKFAEKWNQHVQALKSEEVIRNLLQKQFNLDRDVRKLQHLLILPASRVTIHQPFISAEHFVESNKMQTRDSKGAMLQGLSVLQLMLIIAMKHLENRYHGEAYNFEMIYNEYQRFAQKKSSVLPKPVVLKAFEELCSLELVSDALDTGLKQYHPVNSLVDASQLMEALQACSGCPLDVKAWAEGSGLN